MYWFFEEMPCPHKGVENVAALQNRVWQDQSLVERATRRDNLHLQVLLHDLARWETPADHYFHMVANASADVRVASSCSIIARIFTTLPQREGKSRTTSRPVSPASSQQGQAAHSPPEPRQGHRRVTSDPSSVRSEAVASVSDASLAAGHEAPSSRAAPVGTDTPGGAASEAGSAAHRRVPSMDGPGAQVVSDSEAGGSESMAPVDSGVEHISLELIHTQYVVQEVSVRRSRSNRQMR